MGLTSDYFATASRLLALIALLVVGGAPLTPSAAAQEHDQRPDRASQHATPAENHSADAQEGGEEPHGEGGHSEESSGDPGAVSHSADGFYLNFEPLGIVELPRLFLVSTAGGGIGFDVFGSTKSALQSGEYTLAHPDSAGATLTAAQVEQTLHSSHHDYLYFPVAKEAGTGSILVDFSITRHLVAVFIAALLLIVLALGVARRYKRGVGREEAPRGTWQNMVEVMIVFMRDEVAKPALGHHYQKYLPYILTVFFFILLGNLLGLVPWGITATGNIMVTGTLAAFTFFITQLSGTKEYWKHTLNPPGVPWFVKPFLVPVEIIGLFTKPLALAFRLFGNMVSGHIVIISLIGLIFIFTAQFNAWVGWGTAAFATIPLTIFIYFLKLAVSFIQAYIFAILSALFIGLAIEEHEEHTEPEAASGPQPHDDIDDFMDRSEHFGPKENELVSGDGEHKPAGQTAVAQPAG